MTTFRRNKYGSLQRNIIGTLLLGLEAAESEQDDGFPFESVFAAITARSA